MRNDSKINPMMTKEKGLENYVVYIIMPGVSKTDLTAKFIERENNKEILIFFRNDLSSKYAMVHLMTLFPHFDFMKKPLKIVVPADTINPVIKLENGVLKITLDYDTQVKQSVDLDIL